MANKKFIYSAEPIELPRFYIVKEYDRSVRQVPDYETHRIEGGLPRRPMGSHENLEHARRRLGW